MRLEGILIAFLVFSPAVLRAEQPGAGTQQLTAQSGSYRVRGDKGVQPSLIWDDGNKTYIGWPRDVELPAVFAVSARGEEEVVNGYFRDDRMVIDAVHGRLVFRLGAMAARADRRAGREQ
jgi:type IV secretion system protein VirB9